MSSTGQSGEQGPNWTADARPEPENREVRPVVLKKSAVDALHEDWVDAAEHAKLTPATDQVRRLAADYKLVTRLRKTEFRGDQYEMLTWALADYGLPKVNGYIQNGLIYQLTAERGRPVAHIDHVREHLAKDADDRSALAAEVVANALVRFRDHALILGKWTPLGGASLKTYFVGTCIGVFANIFRSWLKEYELDRAIECYGLAPAVDEPGTRLLELRIDVDPADVVCAAEVVRNALTQADSPTLRTAIELSVYHDATHAEIAKQTQHTEPAIKQLLHRYRKKMNRKAEGRDQ
jgi:DNA-directed RNA polymerase specialized sigma24 family protein